MAKIAGNQQGASNYQLRSKNRAIWNDQVLTFPQTRYLENKFSKKYSIMDDIMPLGNIENFGGI